MKALLYCTKSKPYLYGHYVGFETIWNYELTNNEGVFNIHEVLNGLIVAECEIDKVEEIVCTRISNGVGFDAIYDTEELLANELHKKSCLDDWHLVGYLGVKDNHTVGYALHLSNIEVFDKPKKFACHSLDNNSEFYTKRWDKKFKTWRIGSLIKAPQNMCNVYSKNGERYILISIKPEWLCKILNGEKTIEVRKQILNCLKEMI